MNLKTLIATAKQNIVAIGSVATLISAIGGGIVAVESRYAKAGDVQQLRQEVTQSVKDLRLQTIEDKIFELELKTNRTPQEQAILQRLYRQRDDLTGKTHQ